MEKLIYIELLIILNISAVSELFKRIGIQYTQTTYYILPKGNEKYKPCQTSGRLSLWSVNHTVIDHRQSIQGIAGKYGRR
jgi:hypothetical protein